MSSGCICHWTWAVRRVQGASASASETGVFSVAFALICMTNSHRGSSKEPEILPKGDRDHHTDPRIINHWLVTDSQNPYLQEHAFKLRKKLDFLLKILGDLPLSRCSFLILFIDRLMMWTWCFFSLHHWQVTVDIEDENDEAPVCIPYLSTAVISDDVVAGTNVNGLKLNCHDRDSHDFEMRFEMASGGYFNYFF